MKAVIFTLLGIAALIGSFFAWFFMGYLKVPELIIPTDASEKEKIEIVDSWFEELQEKNKFNGVVLLGKEGEALLAKGYGYADAKKEKTLTERSSLRLASVSKQFTAAGILLLQEQGKLTVDDLVADHLEGLPYETVNIRHLLNQTSGIPDVYMDLAQENEEEISLLTNEITVKILLEEDAKAVASPNEEYEYSNTNYILLARIIEVVSEKSYEVFMKEELFEPLGMANTRVWNLLSEEESFPGQAEDIRNFDGKFSKLTPSFLDGVAGDGAVFTSALDLLIWDSFWYENELISQENLHEAFKEPTLLNGETSDYGFGWMITSTGMWHNGGWLGARTYISRNTEEKTVMAILDNSSNIHLDEIISALRKAY
ncbi:MAG: serine hydrolase domain-containing protein [Bacteroidota bacterium]